MINKEEWCVKHKSYTCTEPRFATMPGPDTTMWVRYSATPEQREIHYRAVKRVTSTD
jgi:hypothetical protein